MVFLGMANFKHTNDEGIAQGDSLALARAFGKEKAMEFSFQAAYEAALEAGFTSFEARTYLEVRIREALRG